MEVNSPGIIHPFIWHHSWKPLQMRSFSAHQSLLQRCNDQTRTHVTVHLHAVGTLTYRSCLLMKCHTCRCKWKLCTAVVYQQAGFPFILCNCRTVAIVEQHPLFNERNWKLNTFNFFYKHGKAATHTHTHTQAFACSYISLLTS